MLNQWMEWGTRFQTHPNWFSGHERLFLGEAREPGFQKGMSGQATNNYKKDIHL